MSNIEAVTKLTGAEIVVESLINHGVAYAVGIPGHGCWALTDALVARSTEIRIIPVIHEQAAVHLADGYYRACGRPLCAFTSIGPGATNTLTGVATAYVDSTAVLLITGSAHTYMRGHSVLQELDRRHVADNPRVFEPVVKEWWQPSRVDEVPFVMHRAWNAMLQGRPSPVLIDLPMDVQVELGEVCLTDPPRHEAFGRTRPGSTEIAAAAELLNSARRPVIVAGGGAITAEASDALLALAEHLGAPVVTTWNGKGAIDETHELAGLTIGDTGSSCGNRLASSADVVLAVGCRFTDWSASSYRSGATFAIPPSRLIQLDIDPREIGKNYPVDVALVADARAGLDDLLQALRANDSQDHNQRVEYSAEIRRLKSQWFTSMEVKSGASGTPATMARAVREIQNGTAEDAIVVTGAGFPQGLVKQRWVTRHPRTHLTSGGFSTMGFTVPAAIGAQLAQPDRQVVAICGDGDFLQSIQEVATAVMLGSAVCIVVLDNSGWLSIKSGQLAHFGRSTVTDFVRPDGTRYAPNYEQIGTGFGIASTLVEDPTEIASTVRRSLASRSPSLVVIPVNRDPATAGADNTGWWDVPVPERRVTQRAAYLAGRAAEQHLHS